MIFNYIRVSSITQNTDRQLVNVECDRVYEEKISGKDTNRPQLQAMLLNIRHGDTVNVHSLDRLGRNCKDLLELIETINNKGGTVKFYKENLTFSNNENADPFQKLMLVMLGAISEFERNLILERQREGIQIAKMRGKYKGCKHKLNAEQIEELKKLVASKAIPITKIAQKYGITRQTVYNYC